MNKIKLTFLVLIVCVFSIGITYILTSNFIKRAESIPINADTKIKDLYNSKLILTQNYKKCGHTISDSTPGTVSYSSVDELLKRYPLYKITSGEGEQIVLTAEMDSYCENHFSAYLNANEIVITRICDDKTISIIKTDSLFLSNHEKKLLAEGITLNSAEALTSFIEDFTS